MFRLDNKSTPKKKVAMKNSGTLWFSHFFLLKNKEIGFVYLFVFALQSN